MTSTPAPRTLLTAAPALLLAAGLAACSGTPPTDASIDGFCDAMGLYRVSAESSDMADHVAAAEALRDTGTPEGAPRQVVDSVAAVAAWADSDHDGETASFTEMTSEQRHDLADTDRWAQLTCSTGEIADLDDYPVP